MAHLALLLPSKATVDAWEDLKTAVAWAKVPEELLLAIVLKLGEEVLPDMNVLAAVEVGDIKEAMRALDVTALKRTRVNLLLNALRLKFSLGLTDYTKFEATEQKQSDNVNAEAIEALLRTAMLKPATLNTVRVAHVLDQASADEVPPLEAAEVDQLRKELHDKLEGEPLESEEFSDAQLTAFKRRLDAGGTPACDYAVLGPYGSRIERRMRFQSMVREPSGRERTVEIAGPDCLDTWEACHQLFRNLCLACKVAKAATLDNYRAKFKERCSEFPSQWGLAMSADVVCRTEHWNRLRSQHKRMHDDPATRAFTSYDPAMPWDSAIAASTGDSDFWNRYFDRKALMAIASGKRGAPIHDVGAAASSGDGGGRPWKAQRLTGRDKAMHDDNDAKRPDGRFYLDRDQRRFCISYHHYSSGCSDQRCQDARMLSHNCEFCRQPHRTINCPQKPNGWTPPVLAKGEGKKGGGKGKGKGKKGSKRAW